MDLAAYLGSVAGLTTVAVAGVWAVVRTLGDRIDELGRTMNARFDDINHRFDDVDRRFDDVDRRFGDVNSRFDDVDRRFGDVNSRFDDVDRRIGDVNSRFDDLNQRIDDLRADLGGRMERMERQLETVTVAVTGLGQRVTAMETGRGS